MTLDEFIWLSDADLQVLMQNCIAEYQRRLDRARDLCKQSVAICTAAQHDRDHYRRLVDGR